MAADCEAIYRQKATLAILTAAVTRCFGPEGEEHMQKLLYVLFWCQSNMPDSIALTV